MGGGWLVCGVCLFGALDGWVDGWIRGDSSAMEGVGQSVSRVFCL